MFYSQRGLDEWKCFYTPVFYPKYTVPAEPDYMKCILKSLDETLIHQNQVQDIGKNSYQFWY